MTDEQMDARLRSAGEAWRAATPPQVSETAPSDVHPLTDVPDHASPGRRRTGLLASAAVVAAALVAGGTVLVANVTGNGSNKSVGAEAPELQGTVWRFIGYDDRLLPNSLATFYISPDGQLIADDTCDLIGAHVSIGSGRLVVTEPDVRYYNCTDSVGEVVFDVDLLTSSPSYAIDADELTITGAGKTMHLVASPHMALPTLDRPLLTGATWKLVKVTDPDGNDHPVTGDATLRIEGSRLEAGDTCTNFTGEAALDGTELTATNLTGPTADCEQPVAATAQAVDAVFNSPARTLLLGTHLTVGMSGAGTLEYEWVPSDTAATDPDKLVNRGWQLTSVAGDPATELGTLQFTSDGAVTVNDSCGEQTGGAELGQGTFTIRGITPPAIGSDSCNPDFATTVDSLLTMRSALWRITDGKLVVNGPGAQGFALVFQLPAPSPVPDQSQLTGTPWNLVAAKDANGNDVPVAGNANLTIDAGGHLSGNDGCNSMSGDVHIIDRTIEFPNGLAVTEMACTDDAVMATEQHVLGVLGGTVEWTVDGDRLTIARDGAGSLIYTAGQPPTTSTDPSDLIGKTWTLTTVENGTGPDGVASSVSDPVDLRFRDGRVELDGGCVAYDAAVSAGTADIGSADISTVDCIRATPHLEEIRTILVGRVAWAVADGQLTITKDGVGALVFAHQADEPLAGSTWTFDSIQTDYGNSGSGTATPRPIDLLFDDADSYRLTTGCHSYAGDYTISGNTITFSNQQDLGGDDCLDTVAQQLVDFLDGTMNVQVISDATTVGHLTLTLTKENTKAIFAGSR